MAAIEQISMHSYEGLTSYSKSERNMGGIVARLPIYLARLGSSSHPFPVFWHMSLLLRLHAEVVWINELKNFENEVRDDP